MIDYTCVYIDDDNVILALILKVLSSIIDLDLDYLVLIDLLEEKRSHKRIVSRL